METIIIPLTTDVPDWKKVPEYKLGNHLWQGEFPAYYASYVKFCIVSGKGLFAQLYSEEPVPRATYTHRDEPVYNDSCMELFLQPCINDPRYINVEINPHGTYLSEIGTCRHDRIFIKNVTRIPFETSTFKTEKGWGVQAFIPDELAAVFFGEDFSFATQKQMKLNVYKCGEMTEKPHYASLFEIKTPKPDYHRPEYFGTVNILDEREF